MANVLKMAKVQSILALHAQGWSCRRIARELGVHRDTVSRYVRSGQPGRSKPATAVDAPPGLLGSKPAKAPPGSDDADGQPGSSPGSSWLGPPSDCEPYRQLILDQLQLGLHAKRIHQDLVAEHGEAAPSYYSVRRFVRRLNRASPLPYRRMECQPGGEAQIDFGTAAPIVYTDQTGKRRRRRPHVLRVVLSHSRKAYSEVVDRQTTENFIRCLENAFHHFRPPHKRWTPS